MERAAIESALALSAQYPGQIADMLGRAVKTVRPAVRRSLVEALAHLGESRPAAALPPLAHAIKDSDVATRLAATNGFCTLAKKSAAAASPYLRIAARDDHDEVRTAAAACLSDVAAADPKGAARMAAELTEAEQPAVRIAAAQALGGVRGAAAELAFPSLLKLVGDPNREVRAAAERAFTAQAATLLGARGRRTRVGAIEAPGRRRARARGGAGSRRRRRTPGDRRGRRAGGAVGSAQAGGARRRRDRPAGGGARGGSGRADRSWGRTGLSSPTSPRLEIVRGAVDDRSESVRAEAMRLLAGAAGGGSRDLLPTFEAMLHGGDRAAREAAVAGIGALPDPGDAGFRLLGEAMESRSESLRTAAARAYGRLAARAPERVAPVLERAVRDPSLRRAERRPAGAGGGLVAAARRARSRAHAGHRPTPTARAASWRSRRWWRSRSAPPRRPPSAPPLDASWIAPPNPDRRWPGWRRRSDAASSTRPRPSCTSSSNACSAADARQP